MFFVVALLLTLCMIDITLVKMNLKEPLTNSLLKQHFEFTTEYRPNFGSYCSLLFANLTEISSDINFYVPYFISSLRFITCSLIKKLCYIFNYTCVNDASFLSKTFMLQRLTLFQNRDGIFNYICTSNRKGVEGRSPVEPISSPDII